MSDVPEGYDLGEWRVAVGEELPSSVDLTLSHLTDKGVENFDAVLMAKDARTLGKALIHYAHEAEGK